MLLVVELPACGKPQRQVGMLVTKAPLHKTQLAIKRKLRSITSSVA